MPVVSTNERVQFMDTDASGIGHYVLMVRYVERAETALMEALNLSLNDLYAAYAFPRVHLQVDYVSSVRFRDELRLVAWVERIGRTSYTVGFRAWNETTGKEAMRAAVVIVCANRQTLRSEPLPTSLRDALATCLAPGGSVVVDP